MTAISASSSVSYALAGLRQAEAAQLTALKAVGSGSLNPDVMAAQSHLETDGWRSLWWETRANPAGIGITGDQRQKHRQNEPPHLVPHCLRAPSNSET